MPFRSLVIALLVILTACSSAPQIALQYADRRIDGLRVGWCQTGIAVECGDAPASEPPVHGIEGESPVTILVRGAEGAAERVVLVNAGPWSRLTPLSRTENDRFQLEASSEPYYVTVYASGRGWTTTYSFGLLVSHLPAGVR